MVANCLSESVFFFGCVIARDSDCAVAGVSPLSGCSAGGSGEREESRDATASVSDSVGVAGLFPFPADDETLGLFDRAIWVTGVVEFGAAAG